jgi:hypothetical protein
MRSLVVGAWFAAALGCAAPAKAPPASVPPRVEAAVTTTAPAVPRRVLLDYELGGQAFPSPLLRASIGGRATWLVVDTGTSYHALSEWLATDLALPIGRTHTGKDHLGREIRISVIDHATIAASAWGMLVDEPLLVAAVPEPFRQLNLGGFLSPQFLAKDDGERVLLDLARGELEVVTREEARKRLETRGGRFPAFGARVCRATDTVPYRTFAVPAYVENEAVMLLIDTGAERTNVRLGSPIGKKLVERANGDLTKVYGAGGVFSALTIPDARVQVGEIGASADLELVPGAENADCPVDGVLGMDILRSCVLSLGNGPPEGRCAGDPPDEE